MATKTTKPAPSLSEIFATNFRRACQEKGLTQEAIAQRAGLSVSYVSMLQRGQRQPPLETVEAFARALKVHAIDLLRA